MKHGMFFLMGKYIEPMMIVDQDEVYSFPGHPGYWLFNFWYPDWVGKRGKWILVYSAYYNVKILKQWYYNKPINPPLRDAVRTAKKIGGEESQ